MPRPAPLLALTAALAACGDPTGTGGRTADRRPQLQLTLPAARGDTITRPGFEFSVMLSDSTIPATVRLVVDSGTAAQQVVEYVPYAYMNHGARPYGGWWRATAAPRFTFLAFVREPGPHTYTAVAADTAGRAVGASVRRVVAIPEEAYTVAVLPDLGFGAGATWVSAAGDVAGWVTEAGGRRRAAVWRRGGLRVLDAGAPAPTAAVRINAAGDVLVQQYAASGPSRQYFDRVFFLRDVILVRPDGTSAPLGASSEAADLSEGRRVLVAGYWRTVTFDAERGTAVDSSTRYLVTFNQAGHAAGATIPNWRDLYPSAGLVTVGFTAPSWPGMQAGPPFRFACDRFGRSVFVRPLDLDDASRLLLDYCGVVALVPNGGDYVYADRYVGSGVARLSRQGGLVAGVDSASAALYLWRVDDGRVTRLRLPAGAARVDSVGAVNARGTIAAYGSDPATGRAAALLLTPSAAP